MAPLTVSMSQCVSDLQQSNAQSAARHQTPNGTSNQAFHSTRSKQCTCEDSIPVDLDWSNAFNGAELPSDNPLDLTTLAGLADEVPPRQGNTYQVPNPYSLQDVTTFVFPSTNENTINKSSSRSSSGKDGSGAQRVGVTDRDDLTSAPTKPQFPSEDSSLCERLKCLKQCAKSLGFSSLDVALQTYYTADLSQSPSALQ